ncbi:MAG: hypothetical protein RLZZ602_190, partial [Pseudomonadota bacterium]
MVGGIQNRPQADRAAQVGAANHADATAEAGALNGRQVRQEPAQPRAQGFLTRIFNQIRTLANRLFGARQQDAPVRSPAREVSANRQSNVAEHVRAADAPSLGTISEAPEEEEMEPAEMAAVAAGRVNKLKESLRELESKLTQCKEKILENHDDIVAGSPERKDHRSKTEQEKNALGKGNDELRGKQEHLYEEKLRLENDISALKTNLEEADRALADATQRLANANKAAHQDQLPEMATAAAKQAGKLYNASSLW